MNLMVSNFLNIRSFSILCEHLKLNEKNRAYKSIQIQYINVKVVQKRVGGFNKHSFSILRGHLNLNQKRKKIEFGRLLLKPTGYHSNRTGLPV